MANKKKEQYQEKKIYDSYNKKKNQFKKKIILYKKKKELNFVNIVKVVT